MGSIRDSFEYPSPLLPEVESLTPPSHPICEPVPFSSQELPSSLLPAFTFYHPLFDGFYNPLALSDDRPFSPEAIDIEQVMPTTATSSRTSPVDVDQSEAAAFLLAPAMSNLSTQHEETAPIVTDQLLDSFQDNLSRKYEKISHLLWNDNVAIQAYFTGKPVRFADDLLVRQVASMSTRMDVFILAIKARSHKIVNDMFVQDEQLAREFCGVEIQGQPHYSQEIYDNLILAARNRSTLLVKNMLAYNRLLCNFVNGASARTQAEFEKRVTSFLDIITWQTTAFTLAVWNSKDSAIKKYACGEARQFSAHNTTLTMQISIETCWQIYKHACINSLTTIADDIYTHNTEFQNFLHGRIAHAKGNKNFEQSYLDKLYTLIVGIRKPYYFMKLWDSTPYLKQLVTERYREATKSTRSTVNTFNGILNAIKLIKSHRFFNCEHPSLPPSHEAVSPPTLITIPWNVVVNSKVRMFSQPTAKAADSNFVMKRRPMSQPSSSDALPDLTTNSKRRRM